MQGTLNDHSITSALKYVHYFLFSQHLKRINIRRPSYFFLKFCIQSSLNGIIYQDELEKNPLLSQQNSSNAAPI